MDQELLNKLIKSAEEVYPKNNTLAKVCVTQAILESGFLNGGSTLANDYNNLFGIKGIGTKGSIDLMTNEYVNGHMVRVRQPFAYNANWADSFKQHKELLEHPRYRAVQEALTPLEAFNALRYCGYATDPNYPNELNEIYTKYVKDAYENS